MKKWLVDWWPSTESGSTYTARRFISRKFCTWNEVVIIIIRCFSSASIEHFFNYYGRIFWRVYLKSTTTRQLYSDSWDWDETGENNRRGDPIFWVTKVGPMRGWVCLNGRAVVDQSMDRAGKCARHFFNKYPVWWIRQDIMWMEAGCLSRSLDVNIIGPCLAGHSQTRIQCKLTYSFIHSFSERSGWSTVCENTLWWTFQWMIWWIRALATELNG